MTDPINTPNNLVPNEKKAKVIEAILTFDPIKLKLFANDDNLINAPIQDTGLNFLHLLSNINTNALATRTAKPVNVIDSQIKELVVILLEKGYNPDRRDNHGRAALHYAASQGNNTVIDALVKHPNIDMNPLTIGGETPLMKALYFGKTISAKNLLSCCRDFTIKNKSGKTALDIAKSTKNEELRSMLEKMTSRYKSRLLWVFISHIEYCNTPIPFQSLGAKQKMELLDKYL